MFCHCFGSCPLLLLSMQSKHPAKTRIQQTGTKNNAVNLQRGRTGTDRVFQNPHPNQQSTKKLQRAEHHCMKDDE
jgi:hypothetical protein